MRFQSSHCLQRPKTLSKFFIECMLKFLQKSPARVAIVTLVFNRCQVPLCSPINRSWTGRKHCVGHCYHFFRSDSEVAEVVRRILISSRELCYLLWTQISKLIHCEWKVYFFIVKLLVMRFYEPINFDEPNKGSCVIEKVVDFFVLYLLFLNLRKKNYIITLAGLLNVETFLESIKSFSFVWKWRWCKSKGQKNWENKEFTKVLHFAKANCEAKAGE